MQLIRTLAALALSALPAFAEEWASIETVGGAWETNWGETWILPSENGYTGTYSEDNGRFELEFTDHVFEGYWAEDMSNEKCATRKLGSYYWGRLEMSNSDRFPGIQMLWGYCEEGRVDKVWSFLERLPDGL